MMRILLGKDRGPRCEGKGVYKGRELPNKRDLEKISRREHLEQEH